MRSLLPGFALALVACSPATIPASQAAKDVTKLLGQKVHVSGVYVSSFSNGGRPGDPWVHVIADNMSDMNTIGCVVPGAQKAVPKETKNVTAEGTVAKGAGDRPLLEQCTFHP